MCCCLMWSNPCDHCCCLMWSNPCDHCCCLMWSNPCDLVLLSNVKQPMWSLLLSNVKQPMWSCAAVSCEATHVIMCSCLMWSNPCDHVLLSNVKQPMWPLRVVMIAIGFQYYNLVTNFHPSPNERAPHTTQYWNVKSLKTIKKVNNNISTHLSKGGKLCHQGR
jgi:hypothetical protein